jgi:hypothetical protein
MLLTLLFFASFTVVAFIGDNLGDDISVSTIGES